MGLTVFFGRFAKALDKGAVKDLHKFKTAATGDFFEGNTAAFEQTAGVLEAFFQYITVRSLLQVFPEERKNPVAGQFEYCCKRVYAQIFGKVGAYIIDGTAQEYVVAGTILRNRRFRVQRNKFVGVHE